MRKIMFAVLASVAMVSAVNAAEPTYTDIQRTCGAEWRESDTRKATPKGEGVAAWQAFFKECRARKGYQTKAEKKNADFVRVPDKQ